MYSVQLEDGLGCALEEDRDHLEERRIELQSLLCQYGMSTISTEQSTACTKQFECHRDVLLKEASWMSTDFSTERKRHLILRKKVCKAVLQYFKSLETRRERQERALEASAKRLAGHVSRLIKNFWLKIDKVLYYIARIEFQAAHRKEMDRHLMKLIEQTERYTGELVSNQCDHIDSSQHKRKRTSARLITSKENLNTPFTRVKRPFLLDTKLVLRPYQQLGLNWLVSMHERRLNGILADEMGLGKTVQAIALLAHLACSKGIWGPHLVIAPTSVLVNWESELKKFCPGLKVITYYGSVKQRKALRTGWTKPGFFHVCVTSYQLAVQDANVFRRKKFYYLILDEAHNIKNFQSRRWSTLLAFQSQHRLLLTGTPLQNSLMELWSLMHFLMPHLFSSREEFSYWFSDPLSQVVEGRSKLSQDLVRRLHAILRPFILRRLKIDVAKQLPPKHEHKIICKLSRRQQRLYEDFMSRSSTRLALAKNKLKNSSGDDTNFVAMMNVVMQLRKVCNHPDLFEPRPVIAPLVLPRLEVITPYCIDLLKKPLPMLTCFNDDIISANQKRQLKIHSTLISQDHIFVEDVNVNQAQKLRKSLRYAKIQQLNKMHAQWLYLKDTALGINVGWSTRRCVQQMIRNLPFALAARAFLESSNERRNRALLRSSTLCYELVRSSCSKQRYAAIKSITDRFIMAVPPAIAPEPFFSFSYRHNIQEIDNELVQVLRPLDLALSVSFPSRSLVEWDSGKFHALAPLLANLKSGGHRCLIFTQMSRMLDVLEAFLSFHGHKYSRLDGSADPEQRQRRVDRFNNDESIFCMVLSTRSGGLGINLVGADVVIFYDSDWNPAMDAQATDRAHRIGQTREVHIYRLVCEATVEENILIKAKQKKRLAYLAISEGQFNASTMTHLVEDAEDVQSAKRATEEAQDQFKEFGENTQAVEDNQDEKETDDKNENEQNLEAEFAAWQHRVGPDPEKLTQSLLPVERLCLNRSVQSTQIPMQSAPLPQVEVDIMTIEKNKRMDEVRACCQGEILVSDLYFELHKTCTQQRRNFIKKRRVAHCETARRISEGAAWERRVDAHSGEHFWFNVDTLEASWWTPEVIQKRIAEVDARLVGYACLAHELLLRIVDFISPGQSRAHFACAARSFARAVRDDKFAFQVLPAERVAEKKAQLIALQTLKTNEKSQDINSNKFRRESFATGTTFHVAANNTRKKSNPRNPFYEPEAKCFDSLSEAIKNVSGGSTLLLYPGHYWEDADLLIDKPLQIIGDLSEPSRVILELSGSIVWQANSGAILGISLRRPRPINRVCPLLLVDEDSQVLITKTLFDNSGAGGATIYIRSFAVLHLDRCSISRSHASALAVAGQAIVKRSHLIDNQGVGILVYPGATSLIQDSYIIRNAQGPAVALSGARLIAFMNCDLGHQLLSSSLIDNSGDALIAYNCRGLCDTKHSLPVPTDLNFQPF